MRDVLRLRAVDAVQALKRGEVSPLDLLDAVEERLREVEPAVNAVPTLCLDRARRHAARLMSRAGAAPTDHPAWLAGLPVTVKDTFDVAGVPTTFGSAAYRTNVARRSSPLVEQIERLGGIVVGKTNVPEFCSGADTANALFGRTANPWDGAVSCGASSGGAAVSVAAGEVWCALGEDTAGSIRIPASFCAAVGLRPTPGLVAGGAPEDPLGALSVPGPLARCVADATLFFEAMLGARPVGEDGVRPRRVAFSLDYGGALTVDPQVAEVCASAVRRLTDLGYEVDEYAPPLDGAHEACLTLLAYRANLAHGERVDDLGGQLGEALRGEVAGGRALTADQLVAAHRAQSRCIRSFESMFEWYDLFITPTFGCPPWPVPAEPSPVPEEKYLPAILAAWPFTTVPTMAACPAVTVPCGRTDAGHPIGLQVVGPPRSDLSLLRAALDVEHSSDAFVEAPVTPQWTAR